MKFGKVQVQLKFELQIPVPVCMLELAFWKTKIKRSLKPMSYSQEVEKKNMNADGTDYTVSMLSTPGSGLSWLRMIKQKRNVWNLQMHTRDGIQCSRSGEAIH